MRTVLVLACVAACGRHDNKESAQAPPVKPEPVLAGAAPPSIDKAIEQSKTEHKPLVVEFSTTWCKPCKVFEKSLADPRVKAAVARVNFVRYDAEAAGAGTEAAQRFHVASFPTFLAIDSGGVVRVTQDGLQGDGIDQFVAFVASAEVATMDESAVRARIAATPHDVDTLLMSGHWFAERGLMSDALAQYDSAGKQPSASAAQRGEVLRASMPIQRVAKWEADLVAEKLELARTAPAAVSEHDLAIATVDSGAPPADIKEAITKVLAAHTDPQSLNGFLYVALAAGANDEALAAAKRVISSSKDPAVMDTLAECYHAHGDKADALRVEDEAIKLADAATATSLAPNRARFATGSGESDDVARYHADAKALAKRIAQVDKNVSSRDASAMPSSSEMQNAAMSAFMAAHQLGETAGAACASLAGTSGGAFARVTLDAQGKVTASTVFSDAAATDALRTCITKQLATATLPVVAGMPPQPIEIQFKPTDH
ncbi:MAG: thioredoxin family protein [Kofleriaceae bacterium]